MGDLLRQLPGQGLRVDVRVVALAFACLALALVWAVDVAPVQWGTPLGAGGQAVILALVGIVAVLRSQSVPGAAAALGVLIVAASRAAEALDHSWSAEAAVFAAALAVSGMLLVFLSARPSWPVCADVGLIAAGCVAAVVLLDPTPGILVTAAALSLGLAVGTGAFGLRPVGARPSVPISLGLSAGAVASALMPSAAILTAGWWAAIALIAPAVVFSVDRPARRVEDLTGPVVAVAALLAGLIVAANLVSTTPPVVWAALAVIAARVCAGAILDRRRVRISSRAEGRDPVTGLSSAAALRDALDDHLSQNDGPALLAVFDLNGFKHYNDAYGHLAGDGVLRHLAERLRAGVWPARTFRLRGDEFAVISPFTTRGAEAILDRAETALRVRGNGFSIDAHVGAVIIPDEAADAAEALKLADQRILIQRRAAGTGARWEGLERQIADAREAIDADGQPDGEDLAAIALAVGGQLDLGREDMLELARAASLHDLGRVAVPTTKAGWVAPGRGGEVDRNRHLIGERLLSSAPDMRGAAGILRSVRERWDGSGSPDGLAGDDIPAPSRVLAVCEAYLFAQTAGPDGIDPTQIEVLRTVGADAGTRFDPWVVAGLRAALERGRAPGA